jgi:murein DD-endopeptidase MepM/ murein hydrolase activator NlpD
MADLQNLGGVNTSAAGAPGAPAPAAKNPEQLRAIAAQFESMLLGQMMKEMRSSMFDDDNDKSTGFGGNPLAESLYSELSLALSRAGGVGMGESLLGPMLRQVNAAGGSTDGLAALPSTPLGIVPSAGALQAMPASSGLAAASTGGDETLAVAGRLTSAYGWRRDPINGAAKFHKGADIAMPVGQDVPTARAGSVSFAGTRSGYGLTVEVDHGDGVVTRYAHLSEMQVKAGDAVAAGQVIAKSGATGRATGPHLHFEVLEGGRPVDPAGWLSPDVQ